MKVLPANTPATIASHSLTLRSLRSPPASLVRWLILMPDAFTSYRVLVYHTTLYSFIVACRVRDTSALAASVFLFGAWGGPGVDVLKPTPLGLPGSG